MAVTTTAFPFTSEVTYDEQGWPQLDRAVDSTVLRTMIQKFFSDGVFLSANASCWQVSAPADSSATVNIAAGAGIIQGVTGYTDTAGTLTLPSPSSSATTYNIVVARLNDNTEARVIELDIIGDSSSTTAPSLTRAGGIYEIGLARLERPANSTTVTASQITDLRANSDYCGQVNAIDSIDTSDWFDQLDGYLADYLEQCDQIVLALTAYEGTLETEFNTWFQEMRGQLSEDAAGHLQLQIDNLEGQVGVPSEYDSTATYAVGEYCIYNDDLYICTTAIATAEAWDATHWQATSVIDRIEDVATEASAEVAQAVDDLTVKVISVASFSSLPKTISNADITANHRVIRTELGTPSAQTSDWTWTTAAGSVTIAGSISGSTTMTLYLAKGEDL